MGVLSASHDMHIGRILKREDEARGVETRRFQETMARYVLCSQYKAFDCVQYDTILDCAACRCTGRRDGSAFSKLCSARAVLVYSFSNTALYCGFDSMPYTL
jgi:hypothetical protein